MSNDVSNFLSGGGSPAAKFRTYGDTVSGTILESPTIQQQTEIGTGKPLTFDDGSPRQQLVVLLQTQLRDPEVEDDDGKRRLFVTATNAKQGGGMKGAFQRAGIKNLDVGGTLSVTYTHDGERKNAAFDPPKQYQASYTPPATTAAFLETQPTTAAPAPAPVAPAASPPAPANLPPGITAEAWNAMTAEAQAALRAILQPQG